MQSDFFSSKEAAEGKEATELFLRNHLENRKEAIAAYSPQLYEAMNYSLFTGGKRFRPLLALMTHSQAIPFAAALEMVHTYSLIHDDLPCMDNDDFRRGQPTCHKQFGEALALLAGDALLTESFYVISDSYKHQPAVAARLVFLLSKAIGASGMVGGQAMDMRLGQEISSLQKVKTIHHGKTAELIAVSLEGAGVVSGADEEIQKKLYQVGLDLGISFQVKDDILDGEQDKNGNSYLSFMTIDEAEKFLLELQVSGEARIGELPKSYQGLLPFFEYNRFRQK